MRKRHEVGCKGGAKRVVLRWLIALWGGGWEGSWEENSDRWDRVDVFRHIVPYDCGCIVAFVKSVSIARTNGITHAWTHTKYTLTNWMRVMSVFTHIRNQCFS